MTRAEAHAAGDLALCEYEIAAAVRTQEQAAADPDYLLLWEFDWLVERALLAGAIVPRRK
jgi:hypothetical protein